MKEASITVRGRTTVIQYEVLQLQQILYARVTWTSGKTTNFYKGMYGNEKIWNAKDIPDDLIAVLSVLFESETPKVEFVYDPYRKE